MDSKLARIIDRMEASGESETSIANVVKAYTSNSPLKHTITTLAKDRHEHSKDTHWADEHPGAPETWKIGIDESARLHPEAQEKAWYNMFSGNMSSHGQDWDPTPEPRPDLTSRFPSPEPIPAPENEAVADPEVAAEDVEQQIAEEKLKEEEEGPGMFEADVTGITEPLTEEDIPEAPVQQSPQDWYEENKERLNNIELDIPEVPEGATEEDIAALNEQLDAQWQEKASELYQNEVVDPHIAEVKNNIKAFDAEQKDVTRNNINTIIDNNIYSWWSEERVADGLRQVLPDSFTIEEGIGDDAYGDRAKGTGSYKTVNNITITNPHGVSATFALSGTDVKKDMIAFLEADPKEDDETYGKGAKWVEEKQKFIDEVLAPYFTPETLEKMEKASMTSDELIEQVKDDIGKQGLFASIGALTFATGADGKQGLLVADDAGYRKDYTRLTDSQIDHIIENEFLSRLDAKEKTSFDQHVAEGFEVIKNTNTYINSYGETTQVANQSEWLNLHRNTLIASLPEAEQALATANMQLMHGDLTISERKEVELQRNAAIGRLLAGGGEYTSFWDESTGQLVNKPRTYNPWNSDDEEEGVENAEASIEQAQADIARETGNTPNLTMFELLEERFNKNAYAYANIQSLLNKKLEGKGYTLRDKFLNPAYYGSYDNETGSYFTKEEELIKSQLKDLLVEQEALKRMYLLNEDVLSIEKNVWSNAGKLAVESIFGEKGVFDVVSKEASVTGVFGMSERDVIDEYSNTLNNTGIEITSDQKEYIDRGMGETVLYGGASMTGVLLEFAVANKATAVIRGASLFRGGKNLNQVLTAMKGKRFWNGKKAMSVAQARAAAKAKGMPLKTWLISNNYTRSIGPGFMNKAGVVLTESFIEGAKFAALPSSSGHRGDAFATGFGFGAAGQILSPALGTIHASNWSSKFKASDLGMRMINNAPRLEKLYGLSFKSPLNFVVGSEVGEMGLALTNDLMGYKEFETMLNEHYGDGSENLKRWASNWVLGTGLGFTHKATYTNWKSLDGIKSARDEALDNITYIRKQGYKIRNNKTGETFEVSSKKNYQTKDFTILESPGKRVFRTKKKNGEDMTDQYLVDHLELAQGLEQQIARSETQLDLTDQMLGATILKNRTKEQVEHYKKAGAKEVRVEVGSENSYVVRDKATGEIKQINRVDAEGNPNPEFEALAGNRNTLEYAKVAAKYETVMEPMQGKNSAEVYYIDKNGVEQPIGLGAKGNIKGSTVVVRYNAERFSEGLAPHELGHSGMEILFGTNARFKGDFVVKLMNIAKEIKLGTSDAQHATLYDQMIERNKQWDIEKSPWEAAKLKDWELFSYIAEHLSKPENLRELRQSGAFGKLKDLVQNDVGGKLGQKYDFTTEASIVEFFGNYIESVNQGKNSLKELKHLQDVIAEPNSPEAREMERLYNEAGIHFHEGSRLASESKRRRSLIEENIDLFKNKPEGWKELMDNNVKEIKDIDDLLIINGPPVGKEDDAARKERINRILAGHSDVIFGKDLVGRDAQRKGEAIDAIISSYRGKTIAIAKSQGRFETPTFENMSKSEKEDFAWGITRPELLKHLDAFNRKFRETGGKEGVENLDLDGYLNSYLVNKLGTALNKPGIKKAEFTGTTTDLKPSQEPGYIPSEMNINSKTDARLRIDIRDRLADDAPEGRGSQINEGVKEHSEFVKNFVETSPNVPSSYRGLKNIKTPKELVDKVFGKNTAERIETIGRTLDIAKKSAIPQGTLSTRTGNVELEGKSIGVANTLQTVNIAKPIYKLINGKKVNVAEPIYKEVLYGTPKRFAEFTSKETGRLTTEADPTGQGNTPKELLDLSRAETLKRLGIKEVELGGGEVRYDIDNTLAKEWASEPGAKSEKDIMRNMEGIRKNYMEEVVRGMTYQASMENLSTIAQKLGITTEVLANQISAGKARLASTTLEGKDWPIQTEFLKQIESREFEGLYNKAMEEMDNGAIAFEHAMTTHFANNPIEGISKAEIKKIASQLNKQFQYTAMKPKRAIEGTMKTIAFPNRLQTIEARFGHESIETIDLYDNIESIREGQAVYTMEGKKVIGKDGSVTFEGGGIIEQITRELGKGAFESLIKEGISKGAGLGTYRSHWEYKIRNTRTGEVTTTTQKPSKAELKDPENPLEILSETLIKTAEQNMIEGNTQFRSSNRFGLFETAAKAQEAADAVYARMEANGETLKTYEGSPRAKSDAVGKKSNVLEGVTGKDGAWDLKAREEFDKIGEENKRALFNGKGKQSVVEAVKDMYAKGDITYRQVRQIVEGQAGPMEGLIKKSASLAVLPGMTRAQIEAKYGKNWVLEHTTPAQYVKARIYEYILSKGKAPQAKALELTLRDYHTTLIPESLDAMVNKILKTNLPATHLPGMDPIEARYYEAYHRSPFDLPLVNHRNGKVYSKAGISAAEISKRNMELRKAYEDMPIPEYLRLESTEPSESLRNMETMKNAIANARNPRAKKRGMSTFDFDETLIVDGENFVIATKGGEKVKISSEQWPIEGPKYAEEGYEFDFSDFANVRGGTDGPLLQKMRNQIEKYGSNNVFVLTARQQASAEPIHNWLKSKGIEIPIENITGLGKSEGAAKAQWMLEKFAEGYNDMYFVDDALPNVEAVKEVLSKLDVKSNVQQARRLASDNMDLDFNKMIERATGIEAYKKFSGARGKMAGQRRYTKSIVVPGAQDFMGLMQNFLGKGKQGNADRAFFEQHLSKPFARATKEMNESRQKSSEDLKALYKDMPSVKRKLNEKLPNSSFTYDQALRTYLWEKAGFEVPELSARDLKQMTDVVKNDVELRNFAEQLNMIGKGTWSKPGQNWVGETIVSDLFNLNSKGRRAEYLQEWQQNVDVIFSPENLNKIEATQGTKFREALEDMLYRMKTGSNRPTGANRLTNQFNNWINGSVGATMFLNMRSAMLQTISATNYINWSFNNPAAAARAFGNQKQYWSDFSMIWNSPMLKQRRAGLEYNVQEAELAAAMAGQKNKAKAAVAWLIKKGFTPTQIADSFAIASGGATYYRNKVRALVKEGVSKADAEKQAWLEFQELTETNQQSSRADLISQQQASGLGRTILAWSNTPMQYMRIQEKAARDIINGRGDFKANISKIAYYGVIQSVIFSALQNALFGWGLDEEEDLDDEGLNKAIDRTVNTVVDSQLRGTGVFGAALSAVRNTVLEFEKQEEKAYDDNFLSSPDHSRTVLQLTSFSPVISSKLRKLYSAGNEWNYNRAAIKEMGLDMDNPAIHAGANVIEATTNLPVARIVQKVDNIQGALDSNNQNWQRIALLMGYPKWVLGIEDTEVDEAKERGKAKIKEEKKRIKEEERAAEEEAIIEANIEAQEEERQAVEEATTPEEKQEAEEKVTCAAVSRSGNRCRNKPVGGGVYCTVHQEVEQRDDGQKVQCSHIKKDGKRCKMQTTNKSGLCYYHD